MIQDQQLTELLDSIFAHAKQQLPEAATPLFSKFLHLYYGNMSFADLSQRSVSDLLGAAYSHWQLMRVRKPNQFKIKVFNPKNTDDDWQSTHTIIQLTIDDMPFLIDSVRMEMNRLNLTTHLVIHSGGIRVKRDRQHHVVDVMPYSPRSDVASDYTFEAPIHLEIDRQTSAKILHDIQHNLKRILRDVQVVVADWEPMQRRVEELIQELDPKCMRQPFAEVRETREFLSWLLNNHFTFLGCRDYESVGEGDNKALKLISGSGLGVLRNQTRSKMLRQYSDMPPQARALSLSKNQPLIVSKTNTVSTVHRPAYTDHIVVKRFDSQGNLIGERRFIGLYTSVAYREDPRHIPFVRHKVASVLKRFGSPHNSHSTKDLLHILTTLPRDDLFHASTKELFNLAVGIFHLQERRCIRLFVRKDAYGRFLSCLVYLPRENFNTDLVARIEQVLQDSFHGLETNFTMHLSESVLARIHYVMRIDPQRELTYSIKAIEKQLRAITESWLDGFRESMLHYFGEELGNALFHKYQQSFPAGYREAFRPKQAVYDVERIEKLLAGQSLGMSFYRPPGAKRNVLCFKLFRVNETVPLSDALPMLENMGLRVVGEQPYKIFLKSGKVVWINDFSMTYLSDLAFEVDDIKVIFQQAFEKIWSGVVDNDPFNRLVLEAELNWREISVLRAYTKYSRQTGFTFSEQYIADTLVRNPRIVRLLIDLFYCYFDPRRVSKHEKQKEKIALALRAAFEKVTILDEDRILRRYWSLIKATLRTNYFQIDELGQPKRYLAIKFNPSKVPDLPLPLPEYETYVYSPSFEGVHLRSAKVARGGIRWSDRREDYRTEVLGLMKAQQVKNAVIVPAGAKGGFVPRRLPTTSREAILQEGIACYESFIRGLLDVIDNIKEGEVVTPDNTVCFDGEDPYLVVAADKGTATFSDIANQIAVDRDYWLGDAFASGGSTGYDHKKMGITARGAWVSAQRHFQELGINVDNSAITVVGIGDMSGDVFGNGMLISPHIKLVAAFNHQHIFLDPNPDAQVSYEERKRLFKLPRSTWQDYDSSLISKGGGVFSRQVKSIRLSPEIKAALAINADALMPSELIRAILLAPVDLIWNGGIGTYVKASTERHSEVGDRSNDAVRVNGDELRARVVCEGGNLGLTQLGRIEFELNGGKINTDFIDNSAGVDCSDHEVNIKILLNDIVNQQTFTKKQRNALLARMTDEVGELVLKDNYHQNRTISITSTVSPQYLGLYIDYLATMEAAGEINRALEFLPDEKMLIQRRTMGKGLTRPELAVIFAYSKNILKARVLDSDLIDDPYLQDFVRYAFPEPLRRRYKQALHSHYLAKEIMVTQLCNRMMAEMGMAFVHQLHNETRASTEDIVRAYSAATKIFNMVDFFDAIESLDYQVDAQVQYEMTLVAMRLVRRATRWLLRNRRGQQLDISTTINEFELHVKHIMRRLPKLLLGADKEVLDRRMARYVDKNVPESIALKVASATPIYHALNIVEAATLHKTDVFRVAKIYFMLVDRLNLLWFRDQINSYPINDRWSVLAKAAYKGDLDWIQRELTVGVLLGTKSRSIPGKIKEWLGRHESHIQRWQAILTDLHNVESKEFAILFVAIRELLDLSRADARNSEILRGE